MHVQLEPPKPSQIKIHLELTEAFDLHELLEENKKLINQSEPLTKLHKTLSRIVHNHQFQTHYKTEINKILTQVHTMIQTSKTPTTPN